MKISGIYKIQSKIKPEKIYIGSAVNITNRWRQHIHYLKNNKHPNKKLQNHYNKYGETDLQFSILLGCEKNDLLKIEQYFIDSYNPWFNNRPIAGSNLGKKGQIPWNKGLFGKDNPQAGKKRRTYKERGIEVWNKGKINIYSEETRKNMGKSNKGRKPWNKDKKGVYSDETLDKMSKAKKNKISNK
jgi:group I intron endonuclease